MRGIILSYDALVDDGMIRAEDGHHYHFSRASLLTLGKIKLESEVRFTPHHSGFADQVELLRGQSFKNLFSFSSCISRVQFLKIFFLLFLGHLIFIAAFIVNALDQLIKEGFFYEHIKDDLNLGKINQYLYFQDDSVMAFVGPLFALYILFSIVIMFFTFVRRLHDMNRSAFLLILTMIPFGGLVLFFMAIFTPTSKHHNAYCRG